MSKVIAIWGAPNSGKTTFATKLARCIYDEYQATVIVVYTDNETPTLPIIFPNYKKEDLCSVGVALAKTDIDRYEVVKQMVTVKDKQNFCFLGFTDGENKYTYPTFDAIRSDDILGAVQENITYLKPPVRGIFQSFVGDAMMISSDLKTALRNLKEKIDDSIFEEWCDTLIACQDDRTLKDTLLPIVSKLTDVRIVNNELKTMLAEVKKEYWMMVCLVVGNIPLLYMLNDSWFDSLMFSIPGKIVLAICGVVILITAMFMMKYTKPIEYKK